MLSIIRYRAPLLCLWLASFFTISHALTFNSTALVLGVDAKAVDKAAYLLTSYGIAWEGIEVPESGITLPGLETSNGGNYGLFVVVSEVQYNATSALTDKQWASLHSYQTKYGVRMVHVYVVPGLDYGTALVASCCDGTQEQNVSLIQTAQTDYFPTAGLRAANLSSVGLYHYTASIPDANASSTKAVYEFLPNSIVENSTVAAVINTLSDGRQQYASFIEAGNWSTTSTMMHHAWIQWGYRGLYQGFRRINLNTQVDDLFLQTSRYTDNTIFRLREEDLVNHVDWTFDINHRLDVTNPGSSYFTEFGFNANGNLIYDYSIDQNMTQLSCTNPVFTDWSEPTALEYVKPLGTGVNKWPQNPTFDWSAQCIFLDPLAHFFTNLTQRDAIGLVSHTFTHLELNEATYHDTLREIEFNLMYGELLNLTNAAKFSGGGLIPPAITGMHNGDALRAFTDNGLWNAIGDNTRPNLRNPDNYHYPLITDLDSNGFIGYQITPRFATRVYYNCDLVDCDVQQWLDTDNGTTGDNIYSLLDIERTSAGNQLLSLFHDPYMFHQPNIRNADVNETLIHGKWQKLGLLQMWVEVLSGEMQRLVTWPMVTLKHDHIALSFRQRMILDGCKPYIQYTSSSNSSSSTQTITGFTITSTDNMCEMAIPVTYPGKLADTKDFRVEQIGTDPATIWVYLMGEPQSFELANPITV